jgi:predicted CXXCH cytochrome family protein
MADAGKCVNCHDPHGDRDQLGVIPSLLRARGAALCLTCHRGTPGADVASALTRTFRHPLATAALAPDSGARAPADPGDTCSGCHNPHAAGVPRGGGSPSSSALAGVPRVRIQSGAPGVSPTATVVPPADATQVQEFEVCFRCHALVPGGNQRPASDLASRLNPANASFHPVTARARGAPADPRSFVPPWGAGRMVTCSDCHSSDSGQLRGPHGSAYRHILKKPYEATSAQRQPAPGDLCFDCHQYGSYGPGASTAASVSRFPSHGAHAALGCGCWSCHDAHGSADLPSLLVVRSPGLLSYARDAGGGSCTTSCHVRTPAAGRYLKAARAR